MLLKANGSKNGTGYLIRTAISRKAPNVVVWGLLHYLGQDLVFVAGISIDPLLHFFADILDHRPDLFGRELVAKRQHFAR